MTLAIATDVLFDRAPAPERLREAATQAFAVRESEVAVAALSDAGIAPGLRVIFQRQPEDLPGDFPVWYQLTVDSPLLGCVDRALDRIVGQLQLVALSDADGPDTMTLHMPNGTGILINLPQGDDDSFRLPPALRRAVATTAASAAPE